MTTRSKGRNELDALDKKLKQYPKPDSVFIFLHNARQVGKKIAFCV